MDTGSQFSQAHDYHDKINLDLKLNIFIRYKADRGNTLHKDSKKLNSKKIGNIQNEFMGLNFLKKNDSDHEKNGQNLSIIKQLFGL